MDLSKYPLDKLFYLVAGAIPGFTALLIFQLSHPGSFDWFFALGFLGYKTKLALVAVVAFVAGNTITTIFSSLLGGIGGIVGSVLALQPVKRAFDYPVAPWRDHMWRTVAKAYLGAKAPNDTSLISQEVFDQICEMVKFLPVDQQQGRLLELTAERAGTAVDDMKWEGWYDHYHQIVIKPDERDFAFHVKTGFNFNMEATSLYVLISAFVVPSLRHWWCILPACLWIVVMIGEIYTWWHNYANRWGSLSAQIRYLSDSVR